MTGTLDIQPESPSHQHSISLPPSVLRLQELLAGADLPAPHSPSLHQEGVSPDPQLLFQVEPRKQAGPALSTGAPGSRAVAGIVSDQWDTGKVPTPRGQGHVSKMYS